MKKILAASVVLLAAAAALSAQTKPKIDWPDYKFETVIANPITPVKNQYRSGTCWAYSAIGLLESEIIRQNKIKDEAQYPDFSEMFVINKSYYDRADKYVRMDGKMGFSSGSECGDVFHIVKNYGLVPQSAYSGMNYGTDLPVQGELDEVLKAYVDVIVSNPNKKLSTAWKRGFQGILDGYLGVVPETFEVDGKEYTAASYRDSFNINVDDYVALTSYTHHPFYTSFAVEVCDNWRNDTSFNVPIDELMQALDEALEKGYTVVWGADVSDPGFTRTGLAILVDVDKYNESKAGSDQEHWVGKEEGQPKPIPVPEEKVVTQQTRQDDFDNKTVTDDHGMLIYGIAKDQFGKKYYMVKNSWGTKSGKKGIWYASEAYVKNQTLDITFHKDALSKDLKKKMGLK